VTQPKPRGFFRCARSVLATMISDERPEDFLRHATDPGSGFAHPLGARFRNGTAKILREPWNRSFIAEATKFPRGRRKDQVDAASGALAMLVEYPEPDIF
jgi:hypothetical protein